MPNIRFAKLIVVENAAVYQLNQVHSVVVANASSWWHHLPHTWIVGESQERTASWWRDQIQPIITVPGTLPGMAVPTVVVLKLPMSGRSNRDWAYFGPAGQNEIGWLLSEYQE